MSPDHAHENIRTIAETLLSTRFGGPVRFGRGEALQDRSSVFRFSVLDGVLLSDMVEHSRIHF